MIIFLIILILTLVFIFGYFIFYEKNNQKIERFFKSGDVLKGFGAFLLGISANFGVSTLDKMYDEQKQQTNKLQASNESASKQIRVLEEMRDRWTRWMDEQKKPIASAAVNGNNYLKSKNATSDEIKTALIKQFTVGRVDKTSQQLEVLTDNNQINFQGSNYKIIREPRLYLSEQDINVLSKMLVGKTADERVFIIEKHLNSYYGVNQLSVQ